MTAQHFCSCGSPLVIAVFILSCATPLQAANPIFKDVNNARRMQNLQEILKTKPDDAGSRTELAKIFLSEDMIDQATLELERVILLEPKRVELYCLLASALQRRSSPDFSRACQMLTKACELDPQDAGNHLNLGWVYVRLRKDREAGREFREVLALSRDNPKLLSAHLGLMGNYHRSGDYQKETEEYEAARKINPRVDDLIKGERIRRLTPAPLSPEPPRGARGDGIHPPVEERIKRLQEQLQKESAENK